MLDQIHGHIGRHQVGSMDGWGKTYDTIVGLMSFGQERKLRQATLDLVNIQPGDRVLEVGCGTGSLALAAKTKAGPGSDVFGIDTAADMIEIARRKALKAGQEVQFQLGRIEEIPFPDGMFNLALSSLMMHHVQGNEAKQKGLEELFRVLKPGGRLLIVDIEPPQKPFIKEIAGLVFGQQMMASNVRKFIPLMENAGFIQLETGPTQFSLLSYLSGMRPN